ncbi:MAG: hypothetical protein ACOCX2_12310 [Armatimonadota bacterium]
MRLARWTLVALLLTTLCGQAWANAWSFEVPRMRLEVIPNPDASATLRYEIEFHCNPGAHPINVVDMGLPHRDYDISNMSASINGTPLTGIRPSTEISVGVEVDVQPAIQPGQSGVFRFEATMPDMVYQDTTDAELASLRITPTWWGAQYITGNTLLGIVVYLPDAVDLERVVYQLNEPFDRKLQLEGQKAVAWVFENTRIDHQHLVGLSFPKDWMDRVIKQTAWDLAWKWWVESSGARTLVGLLMLVAFSIWYFRLTGGTGTCLFIPLVVVLPIMWAASPGLQLIGIPVLILLFIFGERLLASSKRSYLPPIESVPGGEIKRGLTAPEAAVLLERPLGDVLTLVIFGLMRKRLVEMTREDPLTVEVPEQYQVTRGERRKIAAKNGTVIRGYEQPFLDALMENPGTPVPDLDLSKQVKALVENVVERMKGFDLDRTKQYYESIVYKAWKEARTIGEVGKRDEYVDNNIGWLMLDTGYPQHFNTWHRTGYHYSPRWAGPAVSAPSPSGPAVGGRTTAGDVAASFAGWSENVAGRMAATMDPVSVGLKDGGIMNLSGVDKVGMEFLESMAESSGSGGGGGGCACAGCACACVCAGGGR